jgi:hypothetical protein
MTSIEHNFNPIFVVGNSRSGTTLMGSILGLNREVFTFEELHFFGYLWSETEAQNLLNREQAEALAARLLAIQDTDFISYRNPKLFTEEAQKILARIDKLEFNATDILREFLLYVAQKNGKTIPCEQTPRNVLYLQEILKLYPHCHIINMVRDPRDVLLSQKYKWKIRFLGASNIPYREALRSWANYHPITISKLWNVSINAVDRVEDRSSILTIRFEDLIADTENIVRQVCDFIDLEFAPEMLEVSQSEGGVSSHKQIDRTSTGIDPQASGKWKQGGLSSIEIYLCQQITKNNLERYNYQLQPIPLNPITLVISLVSLPIKLTLAVILNFNRMRNLFEEIKKRL